MNANELRIGNWIFDSEDAPHYFQIEEIKIVSDNLHAVYRNGSTTCAEPQPIPLTEDWHNKFGVIKDGFNQFEYKYAVGKSIIFTGDYVYLLNTNSINGERSLSDHICTLWNKDIERRDIYVHEWQNLYFALTGEELTINI